MTIAARHAVAGLVATSFGVVAWALPAGDIASLASLSLGSGVAAVSLMASAALLGSRWTWVEGAFGGLDRVYEVHKWLGIWALVMASIHLAFKAGLPSWETAAMLPLSPGTTRLVRQLGFIGLMLTVLLALNRNIPYSTWRWWHRLSGPLFLVVVAHWLSIKSPLVLQGPAGVWLAGLSALGVAGASWKLLLYPWLSPHAEYRVVAITRGASAARIELLPTGRPLAFHAGQFGFLGLHAEGLREPHPFTLAGAVAPDGRVAFVIRALGDYTRALLACVEPGVVATIHAPFGRFERTPGASREIWIAGGVGISPFLAWLDDPVTGGFGRVTLCYFHTPGRSFPEPAELARLTGERGVALVCIDDGPGSGKFAGVLDEVLRGAGADGVEVSFCGPAGLLAAARVLLLARGVPEARIRHELFEFR